MPFPLSRFNNQLDPTLPQEIIPVLYVFDEYQTYDLILTGFISGFVIAFLEGIKNEIVIPFNTESSLYGSGNTDQFFLIERFTPFNYSWCENYSSLWLSFIKQFCNTRLYDSKAITGKHFSESKAASVTRLDYPVFIQEFGNEFKDYNYVLEGYKIPVDFTIELPATPKRQVITITYLRFDQEIPHEFSRNYVKLITSSVRQTINLSFHQPSLSSSGIKYLIKPVNFSFVVSSSDLSLIQLIESQLQQKSEGFLFNDFEAFLDKTAKTIYSQLPRLKIVLESYTIDSKEKIVGEIGNHGVDRTLRYREDVIKPVFREINPNFYFANLTFANNNYWNNDQLPASKYLGKAIVYTKESFSIWGTNRRYLKSFPNRDNKWFHPFHPNDAPLELVHYWTNPFRLQAYVFSSANTTIYNSSHVQCYGEFHQAFYRSYVDISSNPERYGADSDLRTLNNDGTEIITMMGADCNHPTDPDYCIQSAYDLKYKNITCRPCPQIIENVDITAANFTGKIKGIYFDETLTGYDFDSDNGNELIRAMDKQYYRD